MSSREKKRLCWINSIRVQVTQGEEKELQGEDVLRQPNLSILKPQFLQSIQVTCVNVLRLKVEILGEISRCRESLLLHCK